MGKIGGKGERWESIMSVFTPCSHSTRNSEVDAGERGTNDGKVDAGESIVNLTR